MAAINQDRIKRLISAILLLPIGAGFLGVSFFLIKDGLDGKFDAFGLFVWLFSGAAGAVMVNNLRASQKTRPRPSERTNK